MAEFTVAEFKAGAWMGTQSPQVAGWPPLATQQLTPGGAAVRSAAFNGQTRLIVAVTDTAARFRVGDSSVAADATDWWLPANVPWPIAVAPGQYISVIAK